MSSHRERNDHKRRSAKKSTKSPNFPSQKPEHGRETIVKSGKTPPQPQSRPFKQKDSFEGFIWGVHAVEAALSNENRAGPLKLYATEDRIEGLQNLLKKNKSVRVSTLMGSDIARMLPQGAVHQGLALQGPVPEGRDLQTIIEKGAGAVLILDQVTDPQNIGAIFRAAAAFGVLGVVLQDRHSPPMQGALAKAAAGAIDRVDFVRVTNLSRTLEALSDAGFVSIGLDGHTDKTLADVVTEAKPDKLALVMGSEGDGLRRLVAEHCDYLAKIPMPGGLESLNVSQATAISLYEALGRKTVET